jgi:hypothetical protein
VPTDGWGPTREPVNPVPSGSFPPGPDRGPGPGRGRGNGPGPGSLGYAPSGQPLPAEPAEPAGPFDGGYAPVIRAADQSSRPGSYARPAGTSQSGQPERKGPGPASASGRHAGYAPSQPPVNPDAPAATTASGHGTDEPDTSYWYDLSGSGSVPATSAPTPAGTRGPFEPLVSSARTPDDGGAPGEDTAASGWTSASGQARESGLTAEAIGEQRVDQPFDQLLAQQRELISDYFEQAPAGTEGTGPERADGETKGQPGASGASGDAGLADRGRTDAPRGASVPAEPPRAW